MMKQLKLSNRLNAIASFIEQAGPADELRVIDVGTDHGYLPAWLAQTQKARSVAATDIRNGPLEHAMSSAAEYGVKDRIEFFLTDGLNGIDSTAYNTVVIAGMGGETILQILAAAPWTKNPHVRLILQPQTKTDELTTWLSANGFKILDAVLAEDEQRLYMIFTAGTGEEIAFLEPMDILLTKRDPLLGTYLAVLIHKTQRALDGLKQSTAPSTEAQRALHQALDDYRRMMENTKHGKS